MNPLITRAVPLIDIEIERGGDGRTVTAYAATFDQGYEVRDNLYPEPYIEEIDQKAFNRALRNKAILRTQVIFNHGRTIAGTPSDRFSMPLGTPVEIRAEPKGLLTVTRYAATPLGDEVLELIRSGAIRAQSFRGPVFRSSPPKLAAGGTPVIRRLELGLVEYGPAPFAVNDGAEILAVRSASLLDDLRDLSPEELAALREILNGPVIASPADPAPVDGTPLDTLPDDLGGPSDPTETLAAEQAQRRRRTI